MRWEEEGDLASAQFHRKDREGSVSRLVVKLEGRVASGYKPRIGR